MSSTREYAKRFIPHATGGRMGALCLEIRKMTPDERSDDKTFERIASLISETGAIPLNKRFTATATLEMFANELKEKLTILSYDAGVTRTGVSTGFRAPGLQDEGSDMLQAALWMADSFEQTHFGESSTKAATS